MSSFPPADTRSRPRFGLLGLALVLTFLAGLAVAAYGGRHLAWFQPRSVPVAVAQPATPVRAAQPAAAPVPPVDLTTLSAREAALSAQLASLEARLPVISADVAAAGAQAGRAEALLVAAAARRAFDRGVPLGRLEDQLRVRCGGTNAGVVAQVIQAARQPVTLEDLRLGFDAIAPELQTGAGAGFFPALRRELSNLVVLRRSGSPSPLPAERAARVRRLLDSGQVEAALAEAQTLPGAERAENWMVAARRYVRARRALDRLEDAAITVPVSLPAPVSPPAGAPTPPGR